MRTKNLFLFLVVFFISTIPSVLNAEEMWEQYESLSGGFSCLIPERHTSNLSQLLVDDKLMASSDELSALLDQRPYKNVMKSYIVKLDQTIGPALSKQEIATLIQHEIDLYSDYYKSLGGSVKKQEIKEVSSYPGAELWLSYPDKIFGTQNVLIHIIVTSSTRLEQLIVGPEEIVTGFKAKDFFNSLRISNGLLISQDKIEDQWHYTDSPLSIFTALLPPNDKVFFKDPPVIRHTDTTESMLSTFKDPMRDQSLYFNLYAYKLNKNIGQSAALAFLLENFVRKKGVAPKSIDFNIQKNDETHHYVFDAAYNIPPPKGFPFIQTMKVHAVADGPFLLVQEIMSSQKLAMSDFAKILMDHVSFHPSGYRIPDETAVPGSDATDGTMGKIQFKSAPASTSQGESAPPASP